MPEADRPVVMAEEKQEAHRYGPGQSDTDLITQESVLR
jgi:hypothetical protein